MSETIRAIKVRLFVPTEIATGDSVAGRAMIFAQYACHMEQGKVTNVVDAPGGTLVDIEEDDYAVRRRTKRTE